MPQNDTYSTSETVLEIMTVISVKLQHMEAFYFTNSITNLFTATDLVVDWTLKCHSFYSGRPFDNGWIFDDSLEQTNPIMTSQALLRRIHD